MESKSDKFSSFASLIKEGKHGISQCTDLFTDIQQTQMGESQIEFSTSRKASKMTMY